ncbi:MAG: DUF4445 domain-containing protein [Candidatus Bathyarchaeota archaeon]|nr:MAG: DUF4445 domain-containing protein [Candidatus Bathyarchaeota archaeon]
MEKIITVTFEPEGRRVRVQPETSIFQAAREAGIGIRTECGGDGTCGKCRIIVKNKSVINEVTDAERTHLSEKETDSGYRLACRTIPKQNITVMIPEESRIGARKIQITGLERPVPLNPSVKKFHVVLPKPTLSDVRPDFKRLLDHLADAYGLKSLEIDYEVLKKLPDILRDADWDFTVTIWDGHVIIAVEAGDTADKLFGLAIDIGTSKIVGYVVNLMTGQTASIGSIENPQIMHGEDVISRITFAMAGGEKLKVLQKLAVEGINDVLHEACTQGNVDSNDIYEVTVAGNTAMHHFLLAIQPKYLALSPYTPAVKKPIKVKAKELGIKIHRNGAVYVLPIIAGFVGADAVGDVLSSGIHESKEISLLLDIGTNTEVFVGNTEDILSCSCASGPAFEGAHIKHGMKAVTGAIEKVRISPDTYEVEYETIGNVKPIGLCGSAMVDVVAEMLRSRIINHHGRFNPNLKTSRLKKVNNIPEFVLAGENETATRKEITVTQKDINEIQLAKAAMFTGCSILMKRKNVKRKDLDRVFIAGAFGNYINPENAKFIGLVPDVPTEKINFVGNTAVTGAKMVLTSREARETAEILSRRVRYIELAIDPDFSQEFTRALFIPHRDLDRFPSVKEHLERLE